MTTIDVVIIGLFVVSAVAGYRRGFIGQLGTIGGVVAGIAASRMMSGDMSQWLDNQDFFRSMTGNAPEIVSKYASGIVASTILFLCGYVAVKIFAGMLRSIVNGIALGFVDRSLGSMVSIFISFLVLSLILNVCQAFKQGGSVIDKSTLGGGSVATAVLNLAPRTLGVATAVLTDYLHEKSDDTTK